MDKLKSKKFFAFLVADIGWKAFLFLMIYKWTPEGTTTTIMLTTVVVSGFIQAGYIIGQASLDKYVQIAEVVSRRDSKDKDKGQGS
jgi:hypothetical protein